MQANTDKFQVICIGKITYEAIKHFEINATVIQCESNVTLLGVNIGLNNILFTIIYIYRAQYYLIQDLIKKALSLYYHLLMRCKY